MSQHRWLNPISAFTIPIFDERPWGVRDLRPVYTRVVNEAIGESWLTWEDNRVANGPLCGSTMGEFVESNIAASWWARLRPTKIAFHLLD